MSEFKNFGLAGVGSNVQLGKSGPNLVSNAGAIEAHTANGATYTVVRAAAGIASNDLVTMAQLSAVTGTVTSLTGFQVPLGSTQTLTAGAVSLNDAMPVTNAIEQMNTILSLLTPATPPAFPNGTLTVSNTSGNSPLLAGGVLGGSFDHTSATSGYSAGGSVTRIVASGVTSNTFSTVGPGNTGTLSLYVNGMVTGAHTLTGSGDNGSTGGLVISGEAAYPPATPGFWVSISAQASLAPALQGINNFNLTHSAAGSTALIPFVQDNITSSPTISGPSLALNAAGTQTYSSSVPHFGTGGSLTVNLSYNNLSGETYYGGSDPITVSGTGSILSSQTFNYSTLGISTPIARQTTAATAISPITVSVNGNNVATSGLVQATAKNVNGASSATTVSSTVILVKSGSATIDENNVAIATLGIGSGSAVRINAGTGSDNPAISQSAWTSSAALPTYEAAVVAGVLSNNVTNYSAGYLPVGPNLSTGRSGAQYVTFLLTRSAVSLFKIIVSGSYAGCWVALPGVSDNATISPHGATANGWWNGFVSYNGAGVPGNTSDLSNGIASGGVMSGGSGTFTLTFGTQSSTFSTGNAILVRFKLNSGQSITALSFSN